MKSWLIYPYAIWIKKQVVSERSTALIDQEDIFKILIQHGRDTAFGKDHGLADVDRYEAYAQRVPVRDYEGLKGYFDRQVAGEGDVLWPGRPKYYAKTSGTTSGIKYIPITHDSLPNHINTARKALMTYAAQEGHRRLFDGKVMFLSGSPVLSDIGGVSTGRLSGIVNHEIPSWLKGNQLPSWETNCIEDWESKVDLVVNETMRQDLRLISGIPPWVQMYFERLLAATGASCVKDVFPHLQLFMYGGVNYEPYRSAIEALIGERIDSIELYPASEGFLAYQDTLSHQGLLLNTRSGIFFEFVPLKDMYQDHPPRLRLSDVSVGVDYVVILTTNAGLWAYNLGDTVRFVSLDPYRLVVSGRVKHFISAFGEHVIGKEVEEAMQITCSVYDASVREFTVAPQVNPPKGAQPYHEWFVEWERPPLDILEFAKRLDQELCRQNVYYQDLIDGAIPRSLVITSVPQDTFTAYMRRQGKLGGQNKVPRLSNDRILVEALDPR